MPKEILLFVGPSGAGKDTVVDRIAMLTGAYVTSLSSQVRIEAEKAGLPNLTRGELQLFANQLRTIHGNDVFAKLASAEIENIQSDLVIVNGVRHPDELGQFYNPRIIGIDATPEVRFNRVLARARPSDPKSWPEFLECDARENGTMDGTDGQQNYQCLASAEVVINNNTDSLEELEYVVDMVTDQLLKKGNLSKCVDPLLVNKQAEMKVLIAINGPHGSGKTTVGQNIAEFLHAPFCREIGEQLRSEVDYDVLHLGDNFDREVMRRELLRDHVIIRDSSSSIFVTETWHPGNIAYAQLRSPEIAAIYHQLFEKQRSLFDDRYLFLSINDTNFASRCTEASSQQGIAKLLDFYQQVSANTRKVYAAFNLNSRIVDNNGRIETAKAEALEFSLANRTDLATALPQL